MRLRKEKNSKKYDVDLTKEDDGEPLPITKSSSNTANRRRASSQTPPVGAAGRH